MSITNMLISFFAFFFFISFATSSSFNAIHKCSPQQALDLLLFKESLSSINHSYDDPQGSYPCQDWLGSNYYPIMMKWNKNTDCCKWDGVTCNHFTGDVIAIDLSCGMLQGTIHPNTTLFHLPHLQRLILAYNDLGPSNLPLEFHNFSDSITHLNISGCGFSGEILSEISLPPKLVSLDLSRNSGLRMQPYVLKNLLRSSTHLRELFIGDVDIGWVLPTFLDISSSLISLDLSNTGLQGKLPDNILSLQHLEKLDFSYNYLLNGPLPKVNTSINIPLKWLDLSHCGLAWSLPKSLVNLRHLVTLDLSYNMLNGTLPSFLFTLPLIENVYLGGNMFSGGLPLELFACQSLKRLSLLSNQFDGEGSTPPSFIQLINVTFIDISLNNFTGVWDLDTLLSNLPNLQSLDLSSSGLSVVSGNSSSYVNPDFQYLSLQSCKLNLFPVSLRAMKNLRTLRLKDNEIHGHIPDWAVEIGGNGLLELDLSYNFITSWPQFQWDGMLILNLGSNQIQGPFPPSICKMRNLEFLDITDNRFSGVLPQCLGNTSSSLKHLFLWSNQFQGSLPPSICNMRSLEQLDISHNSFSGVIPVCLGNISSSLQEFSVTSNQFQGPLPPSICNMRNLVVLDVSNNRFNGVIPQCLGNISSSLMMLDMGNNHFHGNIPDVYGDCGGLYGLILNGNHLQGKVPSTLSKCRSLNALDLGNNQLNGTFPSWSKHLPLLQVLVLKSNKFYGPIKTSSRTKNPFPSIQVLDISHNGFEGLLPRKYFQNFSAMKDVVRKGSKPEYLIMAGVYYSVTTAVKGKEQGFPKILVDYRILDLSNNIFEGEIPEVIGSLNSLIVLDLSHNSLTGQIPDALGNLSEIESLDLSWNQLTGQIPRSLADLTFLEFLNLSQNNLVGRIPEGPQFSTFGTSFGGNPKLCGLPLPKCEHPHQPQHEVDGDEDEDEDGDNGFTWMVVTMGYGCGTIIGLGMGYFMLSTGRPKWFNAIANAGVRMTK